MSYVDGFVVPVPRSKLAAYKALARKSGKIWIEHGALAYQEAIEDDAPVGKLTSFPRSVKRKKGEVVVFSFVLYKSRADRDRVNKKVMSDPRLAAMANGMKMPFDGKRMIFGGFKTFLSL